MKPRWRLYYGETFAHPSGEERLRGTYSDLDGPPEMAPPLGVQCVVQWEWGTRTIQREERQAVLQRGGLPDEKRDHPGCDVAYKGYFCWNLDGDELWSLTDAVGWINYQATVGWKTVKFGSIIQTPRFRDICHRAATDPDFLS